MPRSAAPPRRLEYNIAEERSQTDREPRTGWYEHELTATRDLRAFVAELREELSAGALPGASWRELAEWAQRLIDERLAGTDRREAWPDVERQAADKVEAALERLGGLDAVEPAPGLDVFRRTLALELDADLGRVGRLGTGVLVGPIAMGVGLDLDLVVLCGLAEGTFPARVRDDSLLPDADRRATDGALALHSSRVDEDHRRYLAALAAAPRRVLTFPRGDLRRTTERTPSRFVIDTVEALAGERHTADELLTLAAPWLTVVPSFTAGIARVAFPATAQEHRLRVLLDHTRAGGRIERHSLRDVDVALHRGLECTTARASTAFTRYDGNLSTLAVPSPTAADSAVSPTRLEAWAASPFDYLMEQLLRVEISELPEEVWELSALDKGRLVHEILDAFLAEVLASDEGAPGPERAWTAADRARLHELATEHGARYAAHGLTGRRVFWDRDQRRLAAELDRWLAEDADGRALDLRTPVATELRFGMRDAALPAVSYPLSDGRSLRFRGAADRVDRGEHGELVVIDYKTGSRREVLALQLPVYARAARAAFGDDDTPVTAAYWYVSTRQNFAWRDLPLTAANERVFDRWLRTIVDGIELGVFPCALDEPGAWTPTWRTYTDPDARGARERWREWDRKQHAPELAGYLSLYEIGTRRRRRHRCCRRRRGGRGGAAVTGEQASLFDQPADEPPVAPRTGVAEVGTADVVDASSMLNDESADAAARRAIVECLDETMFVEAGAGSGKTKSLVDRVVALITVADVPMREIVAVTFTEKAASELRDRIRRELEHVAGDPDPVRASRAATALDDLDGAAVSTLHAFAQRVLVEHPIEGGLPPHIEVLDDIASQVAFEERWTRFLDQLLDDTALERPLLLALNGDTTRATLRTIALACNANWDLVEQRMGPEPDPPPLEVGEVLDALTAVVARTAECRADDDKLSLGIDLLAAWAVQFRAAPDEYEQLRLLHGGLPKFSARAGQKGNWSSDVDEVRAEVAALRALAAEQAAAVSEAAIRRVTWEIARIHRRRGRAYDDRRASSSSTIFWCCRAPCCAILTTGSTFVVVCASATRICCSTNSRTRIRSSATSRRCSRRAHPRLRPSAGTRSPPSPDDCSWWATRSSRSTVSGAPTSPRSSAHATRSAVRCIASPATSVRRVR